MKKWKKGIIDDLMILSAPILILGLLVALNIITIEMLDRWDIIISVGLFLGMIGLILYEKRKSIPIRVR